MTLGSFEFRKKYSLQHNCFELIFFIPCYETMRLPSPLVVDSVIRFLDTDLSLLERFSLIVVKRKEVVTVTSVLYSCKTLKTPKMNHIVALRKRGSKDFNGSMPIEKILTHRKGPFYIM